MRTILMAVFLVIGIGVIGTSSTFSAPMAIGATAVAKAAKEVSPVVDVRHCLYSRWRRWC